MKTLALHINNKQAQAAKKLLNLRCTVQWSISGGLKTEIVADEDNVSRSVGRGRFKTVQRADHRATVENYCAVSDSGKTLYLHIFQAVTAKVEKRQVKAPAGYTWKIDSLGCAIVHNGQDLHFAHSQLATITAQSAVEMFATEQNRRAANAERERQYAEQRQRDQAGSERIYKLFLADIPTTRVTLNDSRRAGNCIEGSLRFAELRLGIPREDILAAKHLFKVPASRLMASDDTRAHNAVMEAWRRETTICI